MLAMHETKVHGKLSFPYALYGVIHSERLCGFPLHWHDEMEIIYVTDGVMSVTVQNDDYILSEGDMVLVQPQVFHSINQNDDYKAEYYNILFRFSLLESGKRDLCLNKYLEPIYSQKLLVPSYIGKGSQLYQNLIPYVRQLIVLNGDQNGNELLIKSCIFGIMHHICMNCTPANNDEQHIIILNRKLRKSIEFIQNNYSENITVEQAANISNFSASHFSKMFRQLTGTSFTQYLKNYRLELASEKLIMKNKKRLIASVIINFIVFAVTTGVVISYFLGNLGSYIKSPADKFMFFTTDSNILAAAGALAIGICNIRILKGKEKSIPKPVMIFKLMGVASLLLTFSTVMILLIPVYGPAMQLGGTAFHMHVGAPAMCFISFVFLDGFGKISLPYSLAGVIPMLLYGAVYLYNVVFIGYSNGGWFDFYALNRNGQWYISLIIMLLSTLTLSLLTLLIHNKFFKKSGFILEKNQI